MLELTAYFSDHGYL